MRNLAYDVEKKINILKKGIKISEIPRTIPDDFNITAPGLSLERQWYLYNEVRPIFSDSLSADISCPKPSGAKPPKNKKKVET